MDTKQLNCTIPKSDFNHFKTFVFLKGIKLNEAMTQAVRLWLKHQQEITTSLKEAKNEETITDGQRLSGIDKERETCISRGIFVNR